ncbi:phage antirepressor [Levilactobacillus acidifarinae]|uniref:Prophage antirepressor n=1 Tax=Levilactobacillus acidifarinae DSM 19394 = JCM 15949 TaxID=1423715 RepID=A0A0R1LPR9_9LACO|nr:phage antirepressor KilAC domain-containing protein [Levilactobacillus acidifarinae]KRK94218.1 prophage antirepressor [Levilactobacillus acidifarinae DSM 19394]GEO70493.1 antirepressor [Levilactobacillus acidifarinae]
MNKVTPFDFEGARVRTIVADGLPQFVARDVANILGYARAADAVRKHVDAEDKGVAVLETPGGRQNLTTITESGVYSLIMSSKLPAAKRFKHWVTGTVLPSIRSDGAYVAPDTAAEWLSNPDMMIAALERYKEAKAENQRLHDENAVMQPKALFADAVTSSKESILIGTLAKAIKQNGIDIGQNRLFRWMRENNYLSSRKGDSYNTPTQRSMDMKLFDVKETVVTHSDGRSTVSVTTKVTGKGQQYFINKFLGMEDEVE